MPFVAPREDPSFTDDEEDAELLSAGLANLLGLPAISLPCGTSEGLPVGLQLIGPRDADAPFLAAAESIEAVVRHRASR